MAEKIKIRAVGEQCPIPVVKAKKAIDQAAPGDIIEVYVDNEIAVQNLIKMANSQACTSKAEQQNEKEFMVAISVGGEGKADDLLPIQPKPEVVCIPDRGSDFVVAAGAAGMGSGDEQLGRILLKGFFYALSQNENLPAKILFYNSGVFITTEESEIINDLRHMEELGTKIISCGTCLDFYHRKEQLQVGEIGNMYDIAESMTNAGKVIYP